MKLDQILLDPAAVYENPRSVLDDSSLEREEKIHILHRWEYDARRLTDAEGEGMSRGDVPTLLDQVLDSLEALGAEPGEE